MENKKTENIDITNNCIVDLKIKLSKVDYFLTTLLDYNNITNLSADNPVKLISPELHSRLADSFIHAADSLFMECKKLYQTKEEENNEKSTIRQENKASDL